MSICRCGHNEDQHRWVWRNVGDRSTRCEVEGCPCRGFWGPWHERLRKLGKW